MASKLLSVIQCYEMYYISIFFVQIKKKILLWSNFQDPRIEPIDLSASVKFHQLNIISSKHTFFATKNFPPRT